MRRAERLYRITDFLRLRRRTTAAWLAARLDVSPRTIYRDIADLVRAGVPVEGEAGIGYTLYRRLDLPPLMLTREELVAVELGLRFAQAYTDRTLGMAAASAQTKIRSIVPREIAASAAATPMLVPRGATTAQPVLTPLLGAVDRKAKVAMRYRDERNAETARIVWPLAVLFGGKTWTSVCWCELRDGFRSFRLDRVRSLEVTSERYPDVEGRRLEDFFREMHELHGVLASEFDPERAEP